MWGVCKKWQRRNKVIVDPTCQTFRGLTSVSRAELLHHRPEEPRGGYVEDIDQQHKGRKGEIDLVRMNQTGFQAIEGGGRRTRQTKGFS